MKQFEVTNNCLISFKMKVEIDIIDNDLDLSKRIIEKVKLN